jgi:DNA mismatch endonuclease (patch repair protein)
MASIRSKNSAPELVLRRSLFGIGLRYRLHDKRLSGKPDIVFSRYKAVIFVNGCFWHWHGCEKSRLPLSNIEYWKNKIDANQERDQRNYAELRRSGWRVLIVWECALSTKNAQNTKKRVERWLKKSKAPLTAM